MTEYFIYKENESEAPAIGCEAPKSRLLKIVLANTTHTPLPSERKLVLFEKERSPPFFFKTDTIYALWHRRMSAHEQPLCQLGSGCCIFAAELHGAISVAIIDDKNNCSWGCAACCGAAPTGA